MSEEPKYQFGEAYKLMLYEGERTGRVVTIWNSRDGVSPFMVDIDGEVFKHILWDRDKTAPAHELKPGDYFFRDTTREDATQAAETVVNLRWPRLKGSARDKRVAELVPQMLEQGGSKLPWLDRKAAKA